MNYFDIIIFFNNYIFNNNLKASATKLNASVKGLAAIEKHLWNIRKNNTRSKINR